MAFVDDVYVSDREKDVTLTAKPRRILLFSGKRKTGKDYITDILQKRFDSTQCVTIKISGPIKSHWAKLLDLDLNELLGDGDYKEKYRRDMIVWSETMRKKDYTCFCRAAIDMYIGTNYVPVWIVSDMRRKTDLQWFVENFGSACRTVRISADDEVRSKRGWVFTPGIDDSESECNLDDINKWDLEIFNNKDNVDDIIFSILKLIE